MFSTNLMNSIGVDFKLKNINIDEKKVKLQIWDTAGQERFRTITTTYYKGAQAIIIVFDVTDKDSFDHLKNWIADIEKYAKEGIMKILVGNKCDLKEKRMISEEQAREFSRKYNIEYFETSAKDSSNIQELFVDTTRTFMRSCYKDKNNQKTTSFSGDGVMISPYSQTTNDPKKKNSGCC